MPGRRYLLPVDLPAARPSEHQGEVVDGEPLVAFPYRYKCLPPRQAQLSSSPNGRPPERYAGWLVPVAKHIAHPCWPCSATRQPRRLAAVYATVLCRRACDHACSQGGATRAARWDLAAAAAAPSRARAHAQAPARAGRASPVSSFTPVTRAWPSEGSSSAGSPVSSSPSRCRDHARQLRSDQCHAFTLAPSLRSSTIQRLSRSSHLALQQGRELLWSSLATCMRVGLTGSPALCSQSSVSAASHCLACDRARVRTCGGRPGQPQYCLVRICRPGAQTLSPAGVGLWLKRRHSHTLTK